MRKLFLATAIAAGLGVSGAHAADMSAPLTPGALTPPSWKGLYVGLLSGYAWNNAKSGDTFSNSGNRFAYGGTLGFNQQEGWLVYGLEADLSALNSTSNPQIGAGAFGAPVGAPSGISSGGKLKQFGSLRARVGVALAPALIYATGGYAFSAADSPQSHRDASPGGPGFPPGQGSGWQWDNGWIAGGGVEFKVLDRVSFKAEGVYFETGSTDTVAIRQLHGGVLGRFPGSPSLPQQGTAIRIGLSYWLASD